MEKMTDCGEGCLPSMAPLANPYVPFQLDDSPKYDPRKALIRGTLFEGLDLPFKGMVNQKELPANESTDLQTLAFIVQELALYLDTHQNDTDALQTYRSFQELYKKAKAAYEKKYGPLDHKTVCDCKYRWLDDPWPWEYAANQEV